MEALFPPCILQSRSLFIWRQERRYKFVDADDKNCLVQLTVVLEFNQGVRQWPYIIAGVFFFGSFFCTNKRKNINIVVGSVPSFFNQEYLKNLEIVMLKMIFAFLFSVIN